ncbi:hypothetical protein SEVIR_3G036300v4 [Setaria viridis]
MGRPPAGNVRPRPGPPRRRRRPPLPGHLHGLGRRFQDGSSPDQLTSGLPTLLTSGLDLYGDDFEYDVEAGTFGLHDVATGKSFYGEAQRLRNRTWIGGKDDWLVTTDVRCGVELLNPITGERVPLPSFDTIGKFADPYKLCISVDYMLHHLQQVALCQTPAHPNGYLAVAMFSSASLDFLAFTADGDEGWTPLKDPSGLGVHYTDVTAHNGKVFAVSDYGDIYCWDMNGTDVEFTYLQGPEFHVSNNNYIRRFYLATSSGGRLQVVCLYGHDDRRVEDKRTRRIVFKDQLGFFHARRVTLHELDDATAGTWRRVRDLGGDRTLFVGGNCYPFCVTVPPGGDPNDDLQADCVYVADVLGCDAAAFELKLGDDYAYEFDWPLYYPAVYDVLQIPMWFRPTAHRIEQAPVEG